MKGCSVCVLVAILAIGNCNPYGYHSAKGGAKAKVPVISAPDTSDSIVFEDTSNYDDDRKVGAFGASGSYAHASASSSASASAGGFSYSGSGSKPSGYGGTGAGHIGGVGANSGAFASSGAGSHGTSGSSGVGLSGSLGSLSGGVGSNGIFGGLSSTGSNGAHGGLSHSGSHSSAGAFSGATSQGSSHGFGAGITMLGGSSGTPSHTGSGLYIGSTQNGGSGSQASHSGISGSGSHGSSGSYSGSTSGTGSSGFGSLSIGGASGSSDHTSSGVSSSGGYGSSLSTGDHTSTGLLVGSNTGNSGVYGSTSTGGHPGNIHSSTGTISSGSLNSGTKENTFGSSSTGINISGGSGQPGKYTGSFGGAPGVLGHQEKEGFGVGKKPESGIASSGGSIHVGIPAIGTVSVSTGPNSSPVPNSNADATSHIGSGNINIGSSNYHDSQHSGESNVGISTGTSDKPGKYSGTFGGAPGILGHQEKEGFGVGKAPESGVTLGGGSIHVGIPAVGTVSMNSGSNANTDAGSHDGSSNINSGLLNYHDSQYSSQSSGGIGGISTGTNTDKPGKYTGSFDGAPGILGHQEKEGFGVDKKPSHEGSSGGSIHGGSNSFGSGLTITGSNANSASTGYFGSGSHHSETGGSSSTGSSTQTDKYTGSFDGASGILGHQEKEGYGVHKKPGYEVSGGTVHLDTPAFGNGPLNTGYNTVTGSGSHSDGTLTGINFTGGSTGSHPGSTLEAGSSHHTGSFGSGNISDQKNEGFGVSYKPSLVGTIGSTGHITGTGAAGSNGVHSGGISSGSDFGTSQHQITTDLVSGMIPNQQTQGFEITLTKDQSPGTLTLSSGNTVGTIGSGTYSGTTSQGHSGGGSFGIEGSLTGNNDANGVYQHTQGTHTTLSGSTIQHSDGSSTSNNGAHSDTSKYSGSFGGGPGILGNQKPGYAVIEGQANPSGESQIALIGIMGSGSQSVHGSGHYSEGFGGAPGIISATGPASNHGTIGGAYSGTTGVAGSLSGSKDSTGTDIHGSGINIGFTSGGLNSGAEGFGGSKDSHEANAHGSGINIGFTSGGSHNYEAGSISNTGLGATASGGSLSGSKDNQESTAHGSGINVGFTSGGAFGHGYGSTANSGATASAGSFSGASGTHGSNGNFGSGHGGAHDGGEIDVGGPYGGYHSDSSAEAGAGAFSSSSSGAGGYGPHKGHGAKGSYGGHGGLLGEGLAHAEAKAGAVAGGLGLLSGGISGSHASSHASASASASAGSSYGHKGGYGVSVFGF